MGLIKAFFWSDNGAYEPKYATNGCPDRSANGLFSLCEKTGAIATIPKMPGLVVWTNGHIGISIDGVWAIEARGFAHGVVMTRIKDRTWQKWGQLPASMIRYIEIETDVEPSDNKCPYAEPKKNFKKGAKGEGVRWIQWMLTACSYSVGQSGIDGDFGSATRSAVKKFQKSEGLEVDGIVGPMTRKALKAALPVDDVEPYVSKGKIADISKWQGDIDWAAAARELDFCILRGQYGHEKIDERYWEYARACDELKIPYGAYSYCLFDDVETAKEEARFFAERVKGTHPLYLVLDLETGGIDKRDIRAEVSAYIAELRALGHQRVGLYIAHNAYREYNVDTSEADFVWIPRYGANSGEPETEPKYPCDLWQYTSNGKLAGVNGNVDLNKLMDESRMAWFRGEE